MSGKKTDIDEIVKDVDKSLKKSKKSGNPFAICVESLTKKKSKNKKRI
jgi:hypothetical protein